MVLALALTLGLGVSGFAADPAKKEAKKAAAISGTVKSVDAKENKLVLTMKPTEKETTAKDETYTVSADVKVTINKEEKKLADLTTGAEATLTLNAEKKVIAITVAKKKKADK
jgi:hypothetical protein